MNLQILPSINHIKIYNDDLSSKTFSIWANTVFSFIIVISVIEALVYLVVSYAMVDILISGINPLYNGLISFTIALLIFIVYYNLDITIVRNFVERKKIDEHKNFFINNITNLFSFVWSKVFFSYVWRGLIIMVSIFLTSSLLTPILMSAKIEETNKSALNENIRSQIEKITENYTTNKKNKETKISELQKKFVEEMQGVSETKKTGYGRIAITIEKLMNEEKKELEELKKAYLKEKDNIKNFNRDAFEKEFGKSAKKMNILDWIDLPDFLLYVFNIEKSDRKTIKDMDNSFETLKLFITIIIIILFGSVVIAKIFEPPSGTIYFNEKIQLFYKHDMPSFVEYTKKTHLNSEDPFTVEEMYYKFKEDKVYSEAIIKIKKLITQLQTTKKFKEEYRAKLRKVNKDIENNTLKHNDDINQFKEDYMKHINNFDCSKFDSIKEREERFEENKKHENTKLNEYIKNCKDINDRELVVLNEEYKEITNNIKQEVKIEDSINKKIENIQMNLEHPGIEKKEDNQ